MKNSKKLNFQNRRVLSLLFFLVFIVLTFIIGIITYGNDQIILKFPVVNIYNSFDENKLPELQFFIDNFNKYISRDTCPNCNKEKILDCFKSYEIKTEVNSKNEDQIIVRSILINNDKTFIINYDYTNDLSMLSIEGETDDFSCINIYYKEEENLEEPAPETTIINKGSDSNQSDSLKINSR